MVERMCQYHCCKAIFCPLVIAWARTIHVFQGLQAGPRFGNEVDNLILRIIADPGSIAFEQLTPGLLYTLLSRVTTIGRDDIKYRDSALYFFGSNMSEKRILRLGYNKDGTRNLRVLKRDVWDKYLKHRENDWKQKNMKLYEPNILENTKKKLKKYKDISLGNIIQKYVNRLHKGERKITPIKTNYNEWMKNNPYKKVDKEICMKKISKEDKEDEIQEYNNIPNNDEEVTKDTYPVKDMSTEALAQVPDEIWRLSEEIKDVNGNGSCGYYSIQYGLQHNKICHCKNINEFRKSIYDYTERIKTGKIEMNEIKINEIFPHNPRAYTAAQIKRHIWKETISFERHCTAYYWFDTSTMIPIISRKFNVNVIVYAIDDTLGNTYASIRTNNKQKWIHERGYQNPNTICMTSTYKKTIAMTYIYGNHYMPIILKK